MAAISSTTATGVRSSACAATLAMTRATTTAMLSARRQVRGLGSGRGTGRTLVTITRPNTAGAGWLRLLQRALERLLGQRHPRADKQRLDGRDCLVESL